MQSDSVFRFIAFFTDNCSCIVGIHDIRVDKRYRLVLQIQYRWPGHAQGEDKSPEVL